MFEETLDPAAAMEIYRAAPGRSATEFPYQFLTPALRDEIAGIAEDAKGEPVSSDFIVGVELAANGAQYSAVRETIDAHEVTRLIDDAARQAEELAATLAKLDAIKGVGSSVAGAWAASLEAENIERPLFTGDEPLGLSLIPSMRRKAPWSPINAGIAWVLRAFSRRVARDAEWWALQTSNDTRPRNVWEQLAYEIAERYTQYVAMPAAPGHGRQLTRYPLIVDKVIRALGDPDPKTRKACMNAVDELRARLRRWEASGDRYEPGEGTPLPWRERQKRPKAEDDALDLVQQIHAYRDRRGKLIRAVMDLARNGRQANIMLEPVTSTERHRQVYLRGLRTQNGKREP